MSDAIETFEVNGYTVEIKQDEGYESPREWDNVGIMVCFHRRYDLGDDKEDVKVKLVRGAVRGKHGYTPVRVDGYEYDLGEVLNDPHLFRSWIERKPHEVALAIPLYLYDHSCLALSAYRPSPYWQHAAWDSGLVGWIFVTRATVAAEYGIKRLTKNALARVEKALLAEVKEYGQYLSGDVYGYTITDQDGEEVDSLWGLYGYDYAVEEATAAAERLEPIKEEEVA